MKISQNSAIGLSVFALFGLASCSPPAFFEINREYSVGYARVLIDEEGAESFGSWLRAGDSIAFFLNRDVRFYYWDSCEESEQKESIEENYGIRLTCVESSSEFMQLEMSIENFNEGHGFIADKYRANFGANVEDCSAYVEFDSEHEAYEAFNLIFNSPFERWGLINLASRENYLYLAYYSACDESVNMSNYIMYNLGLAYKNVGRVSFYP